MLSSKIIEKAAIEKFGNNFIKYKVDEWLFPCPKCKKINTDNLHVSLTKGKFHCFHCNYGGSLRKNHSLSDVINDLSQSNIKQLHDKNLEGCLIPFIRQDLTSEQINALYKRKLTDEDIKYYNISGGKRIQIPNYVIGSLTDTICLWEWKKENITKYNPKYLYPKEVNTHNSVFNLHNIKNKSEIIVCEGIFNAITAGKNAVATYGCHISDIQLNLILSKKPKKIIIAYDSDLPGVEGSIDFIDKLHKINYKGDVEYVLLPKGVDINDIGRNKFNDFYLKNKVKLNIDTEFNFSKKIPKLIYNSL